MPLSNIESVWKKLAIAVSIFAVAAATLAVFNHMHRVEIESRPAAVISNKQFIVSPESKRDLVEFLKDEPSVIAISTISISLISNQRDATFFQSEEVGLQKEWETYRAGRTSIPFAFSDDSKSNLRMAKIINGNFECRKTAETAIPQFYHAEKYAPITCSISVPPGFDKSADFVGYINFFISAQEMTDSEQARLAKRAVDLSSKIYERDFNHKK